MPLDLMQLQSASIAEVEGRGDRLSVVRTTRLPDVIELFRARPELRLIAVVDEARGPQGVIRELDIRSILFNPYGHALMMNPAFGGSLDPLIKACPLAEADALPATLLATYTAFPDAEGLILTRDGRFERTLDGREFVRMTAEREVEVARERAARVERIEAAGRGFNHDITTLVSQLSIAAAEVGSMAQQLGARATETSSGATSAARGAADTARALEEIAGRGSDLTTTFEGIARATAEARAIRIHTHRTVSAAGGRVAALAGSAAGVDGMLRLIQEIAAKTNLLALNASIEAARAGPSGAGFAVVAAEVKSLANQTAGAAKDIARQIAGAHRVLDDVVQGHGAIEQAIAEIAQTAIAIDTALDAQGTATHAIAAEVQRSVTTSGDIGRRVEVISENATGLGSDALTLRSLSQTLAQEATRLHDRAEAFVHLAAAA